MNVYLRFDCQSFGKQYLIVPPKFDYATKLYLQCKFRYVDTILKISFMFAHPLNVLSNYVLSNYRTHNVDIWKWASVQVISVEYLFNVFVLVG